MMQITKDDTAELDRVFRLVDSIRTETDIVLSVLNLAVLAPKMLLPDALDNARRRLAKAKGDLDEALKNSIPF